VGAPSLQAFKARLDVALGSLGCWLATLHTAGGWNWMSTVGLFNPGRSVVHSMSTARCEQPPFPNGRPLGAAQGQLGAPPAVKVTLPGLSVLFALSFHFSLFCIAKTAGTASFPAASGFLFKFSLSLSLSL